MTVEALPGIAQVISELEEGLALFDDGDDRYRYIIDLGKELPELTPAERIDANLVPGCLSKVWFIARREDDRLFFRINSDAFTVAGLMALVLRVFNGRTMEEIRDADPNFLARLGLGELFSLSRRSGVSSVLARIQAEARG